LIDPDWQEHAINNAKKGYPFSVWGKRDDNPAMLLGSHRTQEEANFYAELEKKTIRPKGHVTVFVSDETEV